MTQEADFGYRLLQQLEPVSGLVPGFRVNEDASSIQQVLFRELEGRPVVAE